MARQMALVEKSSFRSCDSQRRSSPQGMFGVPHTQMANVAMRRNANLTVKHPDETADAQARKRGQFFEIKFFNKSVFDVVQRAIYADG
jgi:hypothetical protein